MNTADLSDVSAWGRRKPERPQLFEEIEKLRSSPVFSRFLPFDAHHIKNGDCYLFAGRRYPLQKKETLLDGCRAAWPGRSRGRLLQEDLRS